MFCGVRCWGWGSVSKAAASAYDRFAISYMVASMRNWGIVGSAPYADIRGGFDVFTVGHASLIYD